MKMNYSFIQYLLEFIRSLVGLHRAPLRERPVHVPGHGPEHWCVQWDPVTTQDSTGYVCVPKAVPENSATLASCRDVQAWQPFNLDCRVFTIVGGTSAVGISGWKIWAAQTSLQSKFVVNNEVKLHTTPIPHLTWKHVAFTHKTITRCALFFAWWRLTTLTTTEVACLAVSDSEKQSFYLDLSFLTSCSEVEERHR